MKISPINRAITHYILIFVGLSLAAAALPLWPGIAAKIPLEILSRKSALSAYAHVLCGFMLFLAPLFARPDDHDRGKPGPWWWVGGLALVFSFIPLFVLAYIAGVSRRGALGIFLVAAALHGLTATASRLAKPQRRFVVVAAAFLVTVAAPLLAHLAEISGVQAPDWGRYAPFSVVAGYAERFVDPPLAWLALLAFLANAPAFIVPIRKRALATACLALAVAASLVAVSGASAPVGSTPAGSKAGAPAPEILEFTRGLAVPGQPYPLRLSGGAGGEWTVDVAGRERFVWAPAAAAATTWLPLSILEDGERVQISAPGRALTFTPRFLAADQMLALVLVGTGDGPDPLPAAIAKRDHLVATTASFAELPERAEFLRAFSLIVASAKSLAAAPASAARVLDEFCLTGGVLCLVDASSEAVVRCGAGRKVSTKAAEVPSIAALPSRHGHALAANLYSGFALPDWNMVDLTGLLVFLLVYHLLFYLIFLLPLAFDARKGVGVYLVSTAFVLVLEVLAAWYALKVIFLRETQVLQQNIAVFTQLGGADGGPSYVAGRQMSCFASFNAQASKLAFATSAQPWLEHDNKVGGAGTIRVAPDGASWTLESVPLDRLQKKQIVGFEQTEPSPFAVVKEGSTVRLVGVAGARDPWRLASAKRRAAFVRRDGRLHGVAIAGDVFTIDAAPHEESWQGVIPEDVREAQGLPFIRWLLGRYVPDAGPVLVILIEGAASLHDDPAYLARRNLCQLLVLPLSD